MKGSEAFNKNKDKKFMRMYCNNAYINFEILKGRISFTCLYAIIPEMKQ